MLTLFFSEEKIAYDSIIKKKIHFIYYEILDLIFIILGSFFKNY